VEPPGARPFTAHPEPARPIALLGSGAILLALVGAAAAQRALPFAVCLMIAALVPFAPREPLRGAGVVAAYAGIAWCIFFGLRVPIGARITALYLPAALAFAARIWALRTEGVIRWARFPRDVTAPPGDLKDALALALRAPPRARGPIDAAVVALAAAPRASIPEGEASRRAFWINVYNVLSLHAGRGRGSNRLLDVAEIFRTCYLVAGVPLTLDEIEHGLLRDGAAHPAMPWARMRRSDPRRRWSVPLDPRVHFALNCGAVSCPAVRMYEGADLDTSLDLAEKSFLGAVSRFDAAAGVVETSRLLAWYAADFGGLQGVRARLAQALSVPAVEIARARLAFLPYDWTSSII
jgi:hypothetical protein